MNGDEAAVSRVLADYYRVFSRLEIEAIVPYFHEPALLIFPTAVIAVPTSAELAAVFGRTMEDLRARGYGRSEFLMREFRQLGTAAASATGVAVRYRVDGQELERVELTYMLWKAEADWRIAMMTLHG